MFTPPNNIIQEIFHFSTLTLFHASTLFRHDIHLSTFNRMNSGDRSTIFVIVTQAGNSKTTRSHGGIAREEDMPYYIYCATFQGTGHVLISHFCQWNNLYKSGNASYETPDI